jgi:hypothetical protein
MISVRYVIIMCIIISRMFMQNIFTYVTSSCFQKLLMLYMFRTPELFTIQMPCSGAELLTTLTLIAWECNESNGRFSG